MYFNSFTFPASPLSQESLITELWKKLYAPEQPLDQRRNQKKDKKKYLKTNKNGNATCQNYGMH